MPKMKRWSVLAVLLAAGCSTSTRHPSGGTPTPTPTVVGLMPSPTSIPAAAFVTQESLGDVVIVSTANTFETCLRVGTCPQYSVVTPDSSFVFVANTQSSNVSVIDATKNAVISTVLVGSGPTHLAIAPNGSTVYIGNQGSWTVSAIDVSSRSITGSPVGVGSAPDNLAVNPNGNEVYVSCPGGGYVSVISTSSLAIVATITISGGPTYLGFTPNGSWAFVTNCWLAPCSSPMLTVINAVTHAVQCTVPVADYSSVVDVSPDGSFLYAGGTIIPGGMNAISVINVASCSVVSTIVLPDTGGIPWMDLDRQGRFLYVLSGSPDVEVVDVLGGSVVTTIGVGLWPKYVAVSPNGSLVYVTVNNSPNTNANDLWIIGAATQSLIARVPIGDDPVFTSIRP